MATTTLTGTTGNNLLNAPGSVSTLVQGLAGNDTIVLALSNDEAQGGAGDDTISIVRTGLLVNTISGGDGNDTVTIRSAGQFNGAVYLDGGNDSISINSAALLNGVNIYGGLGNDSIILTNNLVNSTVGAGSGSDLLRFSGVTGSHTSSLINGGEGRDTIEIQGDTTGSFVTVQSGKGNDLISLTGAGNYATSKVGGGQGADSISLGAGSVATLAGGGLDDSITFVAGFAGGAVYGDAIGVTTAGTETGGAADGADLITVNAAITGRTSIWGAGGNDTISVLSGWGAAITATLINGGDGADSIYIGGSGANYGIGSISGGSGNDTITITDSALSAAVLGGLGTIYGGAGTDKINLQEFSAVSATIGANGYTGATYGAVLGDMAAGDSVYIFSADTFTAGGSNSGVNWAGGVPSIFVGSSLTAISTAFGTANGFAGTAGSIGVFSDGTDSVIAVKDVSAASGIATIFVKGVDLTITTLVGQSVVMTATTFRFSVAAQTGGGFNINFT